MSTNDPRPGAGAVPVPTPDNAKQTGAVEPQLGDGPLEEHIRTRAHQIWEEEGCPAGKDLEHWEKAVAELKTKSKK